VACVGDCEVAVFRRQPPPPPPRNWNKAPQAAAQSTWAPVYKSGQDHGAAAAITTKGIIVHPGALGTRECRVALREGDVVLVGSAGFFCNISEKEVADTLAALLAGSRRTGGREVARWPAASWLLGAAPSHRRVATDLAKKAWRNWLVPDDITVAAGVVTAK